MMIIILAIKWLTFERIVPPNFSGIYDKTQGKIFGRDILEFAGIIKKSKKKLRVFYDDWQKESIYVLNFCTFCSLI